jgi:transketolase
LEPNKNADITIDGDTACAFTENVEQRFLAYGWQVLHVDKGDYDLEAISNAIEEGQKEKNKPTIIRLRTTIGFGSKQQGTHGVHGSGKCPKLARLTFSNNQLYCSPQGRRHRANQDQVWV